MSAYPGQTDSNFKTDYVASTVVMIWQFICDESPPVRFTARTTQVHRESEQNLSDKTKGCFAVKYFSQSSPMKEKRGTAFLKKFISSYLNPGGNGGQWVFPSLLEALVHLAMMKLGRKRWDFPPKSLFRKPHYLLRNFQENETWHTSCFFPTLNWISHESVCRKKNSAVLGREAVYFPCRLCDSY